MIDRIKMLFGWDLLIAFLLTGAMCYVVPPAIPNIFAKDMFSVGISVLSIVFSVFITALAIIMSSSDDEFLTFLEEDGLYTLLLWGFKTTLILLFIALMYSLTVYTMTSHQLSNPNSVQSKWWVVAFVLMFSWSLLATLSTTFASIKYAQKRIVYLTKKKSD